MSASHPDPTTRLPLRPVEFQILVSLGRDARHGYGILQDAEARGNGTVPGLATLYRALKRLEDDGLIHEVGAPASDETDGPPRRYFALTPFGRNVAAAEVRRLATLLDEAERAALLGGGG